MSIQRQQFKFERFTPVPNDWLRDKRLTMADKGLLGYIMSHTAGYDLTIEQVVAQTKDGADAVNSAMKRLEKVGYLRRERRRDPSGRLGPYDWHLQEPPDQSGNPATGSDLQECDVSAGGDQSGKTSPGKTSLANAGTKKTMAKNTTAEDYETSAASRASSSSTASPRDDDEARKASQPKIPRQPKPQTEAQRQQKITDRKRRERAVAVEAIVTRLNVTPSDAEVLCTHLVEDHGAGKLDSYVDAMDDADLEERFDEAHAIYGPPEPQSSTPSPQNAANEWDIADVVADITGKIRNHYRRTKPANIDAVGKAIGAALRAGASRSDVYDAFAPSPHHNTIYIDDANASRLQQLAA